MKLASLIASIAVSGQLQADRSVCVVATGHPTDQAEVIAVFQYNDGVEVIVGFVPPQISPGSHRTAIAVIKPWTVDLPVAIPPLSISSVRHVDGKEPIGQYARQDTGLVVLYNWENPGEAEPFDYDLVGKPDQIFHNSGEAATQATGWMSSQLLGWVYLHPSGWAFNADIGWFWPTTPEVVIAPSRSATGSDTSQPFPPLCPPRGLWFWSNTRQEWGYTTDELYPGWRYWPSAGWAVVQNEQLPD